MKLNQKPMIVAGFSPKAVQPKTRPVVNKVSVAYLPAKRVKVPIKQQPKQVCSCHKHISGTSGFFDVFKSDATLAEERKWKEQEAKNLAAYNAAYKKEHGYLPQPTGSTSILENLFSPAEKDWDSQEAKNLLAYENHYRATHNGENPPATGPTSWFQSGFNATAKDLNPLEATSKMSTIIKGANGVANIALFAGLLYVGYLAVKKM